MKKFVVLLLVVMCGFAVVNRERLFVRDPLASVLRSGSREDGAQVLINYSNDVLLENDHPPMYFNILQHGQPPGAPGTLKCIHYLICLASGYPAPQSSALPDAHLEEMNSRQVRFTDSDGREVVIRLH